MIDEVRNSGRRRAIVLPDYCNTPDAMAVLPDGNVILSVPNFTDPTSPGVLMKITPNDEVSLFCKLPLHPQTGRVYPMGVRQAPSGDLYVADCQCMEKPPDNSRLLRVRVADGKPGARRGRGRRAERRQRRGDPRRLRLRDRFGDGQDRRRGGRQRRLPLPPRRAATCRSSPAATIRTWWPP